MEKGAEHIHGFLSYYRLMYGPWQAFERAVARMLAHRGWDSYEVVGGSGDMGADVIASKGNIECIFQVKFSENPSALSVDIVGDVKRAIEFYGIERGVCVSNRLLGTQQKKKLEALRSQGFEISSITGKELIDSFDALPLWAEDNREPRNYQLDAIEKLILAYENNERTALISLATGLGKTYVAGRFLKYIFQNEPNFRVLILADKKELIRQFDLSIWKFLPKTVATHLVHSSEKPGFTEGVILSTFQSFLGFHSRNQHLGYDIVIVDEAHHAPAESYSEVLQELSPKFLIGLTATPFRSDGKEVTDLFGEPLIQYGVLRAMANGYLSHVDYRLKSDNLDSAWISENSLRGYTIRQLNKKVFIPERDEQIANQIMGYWRERSPKRGIIFCNSSLHAEKVERILRSGFNFPVKSLTTRIKDSKERAKRLRLFRNGEVRILTCYDMLNEGIDVPDVDFLVYLRVTHSRVVFLQQLGRGLRYKPGKTLFVLDYVADLRRLDEVLKLNSELRDSRESSSLRGDVEEIHLPNNFAISFSDEATKEFINLVERDKMELCDLGLDDIIK